MNEQTIKNEATETNQQPTAETTALTTKPMTDEFAVVDAGEGQPLRYTTTTDDVKLFNAINGTGEKVKSYLNQDVVITDIVISNATVNVDMNDVSEDPEKCDKPCVHFIMENGEQISSISNGIIRAAKNLLGVGFIPTPEHPFVIRFKEIETKKGTAHTFNLIEKR